MKLWYCPLFWPWFCLLWPLSYVTLWDPVRANAAEARGEDINGFLRLERELSQREFLMELLHQSSYSVTVATMEYKRLKTISSEIPTNEFTREENAKLSRLINKFGKDFQKISLKMKRTKADCMRNYYYWKRTNREAYAELKKRWKSDYCAICEDGGDMLVCDGCEHAYHPGCLNPPLKKVPEGDWFCPYCVDKKKSARGKSPQVKTPLPGICSPSHGKPSTPAMNFTRHVKQRDGSQRSEPVCLYQQNRQGISTFPNQWDNRTEGLSLAW